MSDYECTIHFILDNKIDSGCPPYEPIYGEYEYVLMSKFIFGTNITLIIKNAQYAVFIKTKDRYYRSDFIYYSFCGFINAKSSIL